MTSGLIIVIVLVVVVLALVSMYNGLITLKNRVDEAWSDIDVQLKRRHDLIPNLVSTVKGYATHEKELFEKNLLYSTEFSKYLLDHPEMESRIPEDAGIFFLVDGDSELSKRNTELAKASKLRGERVLFVRSKGLRAESSRLIEPNLEQSLT